MSEESKAGKSVADKMRDSLRINMHLSPTPEGAQCAEQERGYLEQTIKDELPQLTASDVMMVYIIVIELADQRVL